MNLQVFVIVLSLPWKTLHNTIGAKSCSTHPNAVTIVGGDLQTNWGTHSRKGEILHSALPRFTCPTASLPPSFDPPSRLAASSIDHFLLGPTHHTAPGPQPSPSLTYSAFSDHQSVNLALYTHCLPNPLPNQPASPPSKRKLLLPIPPAALPSWANNVVLAHISTLHAISNAMNTHLQHPHPPLTPPRRCLPWLPSSQPF